MKRIKLILCLFFLIILVDGVCSAASVFSQDLSQVFQDLPFLIGQKEPVLKERLIYDLKGSLVGSYFSLKNTKWGEGFLVIKKGKEPIVLSFGVLDFISHNLDNCNSIVKLAIKKRYNKDVLLFDNTLGYASPFFYFIRYSFKSDNIPEVIMDLVTHRVVYPDSSSTERKFLLPEEKNSLEEANFQIIKYVPKYKLYVSERATCIAMIMGYWSKKGFPQLYKFSSGMEEKPEKLIEELGRFEKGCSKCGVETALYLFASSRGYKMEVDRYIKDPFQGNSLFTFQHIKDWVKKGEPFLIESSVAGIKKYAVGIGYADTPQGKFVVCSLPFSSLADFQNNLVFFKWRLGTVKVYHFRPYLQ